MDYKNQVAQAVAAVVPELDEATILSKVEVPKDSSMGDFAFPTFLLAKERHMAPNQIAAEVAEAIDASNFKQVEAAGPYVNFFLNQENFGADVLHAILENQEYGHNTDGEAGHVTIDMSSPNIAKPMSMGHLRSTVIGNSLAEISKANGYQPIKINHLGDWGTQFGKLMVAYKMWGSEAEVKADPINTLVKYYVRFHEEAKENPALDDEGRAWFKKLEDGDEEARQLWSWFREESLKEFMELYETLDIEFDSFNGEAFYNDKMDGVIDKLKEEGLLVESQGAQVVNLDKYNLNVAMIQRTDGATLYMTRDLAAAIFRKKNYNFVKSLYVVGGEQREHFMQLKAVLKEMGYEWSDDVEHIPFGLITVDGKKLSTRSGRIILLKDVLKDSVELALEQIEEKNPTLANKELVAHEVGTGAVVFHDLMNERIGNFDFKLEEVVRFEGDTGPYVQYANARAQSILRKAGNPELDLSDVVITDENVWETEKLLGDFNDVVRRAWRDREPSVIAKYALNLARTFNKYYANSKILADDGQLNARLALVTAVSQILTESLRLLGVKAPKEM
ncbi:arginine--tRNA ligase [Weissella confusa]|uniref:arginine--tRNA ligase n=1 Tax=Weissella confusa TaxID=1583 RepID=UPI000704ECC2|nr:arginine--tRNA ligase [Weissella confusa]KRN22438.1 arginyl-tRNA synthetase [Weissella confusa]MBJ7699298.1 arginine--tRNA ligase [Weissella confusa]MBS7551464.1 arginine--tRNA ligase [Weissella confusa]MCQ8097342.1 arginine--tRNA ligase [Weissella confusa]MCQ8146726.1 arginine--tRNA ligase [Weissella confusa]